VQFGNNLLHGYYSIYYLNNLFRASSFRRDGSFAQEQIAGIKVTSS